MSFLSSFNSVIGKKPSLAIDIGTTSLKIVDITRSSKGLELRNYAILEDLGYLERANEAVQTSSLKISEDKLSRYLALMLERGHFSGRDAVASVPPFSAFSTLLELPVATDTEVRKVIELQAKQYIPLPLSAVTIDWIKVGERRDSSGTMKTQVMLAAIPNEQIATYRRAFKKIGLELHSVEIEGMSIARALTRGSAETTLIIDIGSRSTGLAIARSGFLYFSGQTDFSGGSLTQTIARGLNISDERAEDLKRARGLSGFGGEHELSTLIEPILDVIMSEGKRIISSYENAYQDKVKAVLVAGGGANLPGIVEYFSKYFALPSEKGNPFTQIKMPAGLDPVTASTGPLLAVALGLGMKELI
jgi:type IV pilus assembly protein PilM